MTEQAQINEFNGLQGNAVQRLINNNMNISVLKPYKTNNGSFFTLNGKAVPTTNGILRKDEWKAMDEAVVAITESRLVVANDLRDAGLVRNLGGLGTTVDQYETSSDMNGANVDMMGTTQGQKDQISFTTNSVPIPIIHKDFSVNIRRLQASRKMGDPIDTMQANLAARKVAEKVESMIFDGLDVNFGGYGINGLTDTANTGSVSSWSGSGTDPYEDIVDMIDDAEADNYYGPYYLYVGRTNGGYLRLVYSDGSGQTKRDRILQLENISQIRTADALGATDALLVQMTPDVIDLSVGQGITTVEWSTDGGMSTNYKVMTALAPRVKSDDDGNEGIVYYS